MIENKRLLTKSFSPVDTLPPLPTTNQSPLDLLSILLAHQLAYGPTERDCVILRHELGTIDPSTNESVLLLSTMVAYGTPGGDSAMATTVGIVRSLTAKCHLCYFLAANKSTDGIANRFRGTVVSRLKGNGERNRFTRARTNMETSDGTIGVERNQDGRGD